MVDPLSPNSLTEFPRLDRSKIAVWRGPGHPPCEVVNNGLAVMWQLTLDAWSFQEAFDVEPRLQRHVTVFSRK